MALYKVYTGKSSPTKERNKTREEMLYAQSHSNSSFYVEEIEESSIFDEQGSPEGFESEDITATFRYANTLRKMCIYGGVWLEYLDEYGVRRIEYVRADYCLYFKSASGQRFIEGDNLLSLKNLACQMAKEEQGRWSSFDLFDYYAGGRLLWRLTYQEWMEKQNANRNAWAVSVFLLLAFIVHYLLCK